MKSEKLYTSATDYALRLLGRSNNLSALHQDAVGALVGTVVDMLDGTPILDLKPYLSSVPAEMLRRGWLDKAENSKVT